MKKLLVVFISLLSICSLSAQVKKNLVRIDSKVEKESIEFKYNGKHQLLFFAEKGIAFYQKFSLKYDKNNRLIECNIDRDMGDMVTNTKYSYDNPNYITLNVSTSGRLQQKGTETSRIHIDDKGRLIETTFAGKIVWEEFSYDDNNNLAQYIFNFVADGGQRKVDYTYGEDISALSNIKNLPLWFWAYYMNSLKWCAEFMGDNNAKSFNIDDINVSEPKVTITYEFDMDGYPIKQFYNGELAREFIYR